MGHLFVICCNPMKIPINISRLTPLISLIYKGWIASLRYDSRDEYEAIRKMNDRGDPLVLCLWHEELFALAGFGYRQKCKAVTVVSQSKDGQILAETLEKLGYSLARGSSSRGGVRALLQAKRLMEQEGRATIFTVDGPRGPRQNPKEGPIFLAQRTNAHIVPMRLSAKRKYVLKKTWDQFQVPLPFSYCRVHVGTPYKVTQEKLTEECMAIERQRLRKALQELVQEED